MVRLAPSYAIAKLEAGLVEHKLGTGGDAVTKESVTKEFQMLFENKTNEIFEAIWNNNTIGANNTGLRGSLFKDDGIDFTQPDNIIRPIGLTKFQEKANNLSSPLYNFIEVK